MTDGGVLVVRFSGPITSGAMLDALKRPIAAQLGAQSRAVLADYTAATLALSGPEILQMMAGGEPHNLPDLPAVVAVDNESHARLRHAAFMAGFIGGATRIVTGSMEAAFAAIAAETAPRF
jgi:hypothetical protein